MNNLSIFWVTMMKIFEKLENRFKFGDDDGDDDFSSESLPRDNDG